MFADYIKRKILLSDSTAQHLVEIFLSLHASSPSFYWTVNPFELTKKRKLQFYGHLRGMGRERLTKESSNSLD